MELSIIERSLGWLLKPALFVFRYLRHRPHIKFSLEQTGTEHSGEGQPTYRFKWRQLLIIHNDSAHLARGVKLTTTFPKSWTIGSDFPTRIEPDERIKIPLTIEFHEEQSVLVKNYGTSSQKRMSNWVEADLFKGFKIRILFENQSGRRFHQEFSWNGKSFDSEFIKKRTNGSKQA